MAATLSSIDSSPPRASVAVYPKDILLTDTSRISICAAAVSPVPHSTYVVELPAQVLLFRSIDIALPVTFVPPLPPAGSLIELAHYLSALAWSPWSQKSVKFECLDLLGDLARLAKVLRHIVQDDHTRNFLTLLSCLGRRVPLRTGEEALLCGVGRSMKAIVMQGGAVSVIHQDAVLFALKPPISAESGFPGA